MKKLNLIGKKFGRLTVLKESSVRKKGGVMWECICRCGCNAIVRGNHLNSGKVKSCGCFNIECAEDRAKTHNQSKTRLYNIWSGMRARCFSPNSNNYKNYGGRGISVCREWKHSYESFSEWARNNGYRKDLSIDRIDNNRSYEPSNCRWATTKEQSRNQRKNVKHLGEIACDASIRLGGGRRLVDTRVRTGWSKEKAFTKPVRGSC